MKPIVLALVVLALGIGSRSLAAENEPTVEVTVKTIVVDPFTDTPVVLLESAKDKKALPIWIGMDEAASIALELKKVSMPRPNAHDLIRNILQGLGAAIQRITITDIRNDIYYATISLRLKGLDYSIDSRPSDAIAVALRTKAPIYATAKVLANAKSLSLGQSPGESQRLLGLQVQDLTPELAGLFDVPIKGGVLVGVLVAEVVAGSPASDAGIQRGDVISKVNEKSVQKTAELESFLQTVKKGAPFKLEVIRKGKTIAITMALPS
jgi:bifunctional DNase/RNase